MRHFPTSIALSLLVAACVPPNVDLDGKACPCAEGWVCGNDQICVRSLEAGSASSPCGNIPHLFCEDFEGSPPTWDQGIASRDSTQAASGQYSWKVSTTGAGDLSRTLVSFRSSTTGAVWLRMSTRIPVDRRIEGIALAVIGEEDSFNLVLDGSETYLYDSQHSQFSVAHSGLERESATSWQCWEFRIVDGNGDGSVTVFRNGAEVARRDGLGPGRSAPITSLRYGLTFVRSGQSAIDAYLDDVIVSESRVPCGS